MNDPRVEPQPPATPTSEGAGRRPSWHRPAPWIAAVAVSLLAAVAAAQYAVRPADPSGLSIREPRVRVIHSDSPEVPGTSMHLQQWDPWLAYQRGRSYFLREWTPNDGVYDFIRPQFTEAASTNSCGMCHNLPFPSVGSGGNVAVDVGVGRNTPHFFGGGLLESIGLQIRAQILNRYDLNRNGFLDIPEETAGKRVVVEASPGVEVDFGSLDDGDGNGRPDLNPSLMVRMIDADGNLPPFGPQGRPLRLGDEGIQGFDLAVGAFASSAGDHQFPSMRMFAAGVYHIIMGILPEGTISRIVAGPKQRHMVGTWGDRSNAGAFLSEVVVVQNPMDEPDQTQRASISRGELDLLEWFMMNHPAPAVGRQDDQTRRGRKLLNELGCTSCHVERWDLLPADDELGLPGDRRFFDLQVAYSAERGRLEGRLVPLTREVEGPNGERLLVPRRDGTVVDGIYTDLRHHDLGPRFWEYKVYGDRVFVTKAFRTAPLWGIGSSSPYGHDGQSLSLDDVIRRHGGEAEESSRAWAAAPAEDREAVLAFLRSLVLYRPETLPTDIDGDGLLVDDLRRGERDLGPEVFRPELLFRNPPEYRGWVEEPGGGRYFSYELLNLVDAYGLELDGLRDLDRNGVPDLVDIDRSGSASAAAAAASGR